MTSAMGLLVAALFAVPDTDQLGTFGFTEGMTVAELERIAGPLVQDPKVPVKYSTKRAPNPHAAFQEYWLLVGPKGLCKVAALGKFIETDRSGTQLRGEFDALRATLEQRFGAATEIVDVAAGADEFMSRLIRREPLLRAVWDLKGQAIRLDSVAKDGNHGLVVLEFEFQSFMEWHRSRASP